jgi:deazaflavin-dependent oxidoreductase (nitroreductase family)
VTDGEDRNTRITREFRENGGKVGGPFANGTIILLHTTGAKSGQERVAPLVAQPLDGGRYAIFASKGGSPTHPDWYHNLRANPQVTYEVGTDTGIRTVRATARVTKGEERDRIWTKQKHDRPNFAEYEQKTTRQIPVIVLEPQP